MIVFSINIHEKPRIVMRQLLNLKQYVKLPYRVILHPNEVMFYVMKLYRNLEDLNTTIHPQWTTKQRYHGSLYGGICSNMELALKLYPMTHFIVLSSKNLFYRSFTSYQFPPSITGRPWNQLSNWHWASMKRTRLSAYLHERGHMFCHSPHEGLVLEASTCRSILQFLSTYPDIHSNLLQFPHCVEEFALQSLALTFQGNVWCINTSDVHTFKHLPSKVEPNTYTWKTFREFT
jgi:hypothetical protein